VRDLTGGGVDHVVEVGGPGTLAQSIAAVRVGGHISLIGVLTGRQGEVPTVDLLAKQARLQGLMVGSRRQQQDYVAALEQSGVQQLPPRSVGRRLPLPGQRRPFRQGRRRMVKPETPAVRRRARGDWSSSSMERVRGAGSAACRQSMKERRQATPAGRPRSRRAARRQNRRCAPRPSRRPWGLEAIRRTPARSGRGGPTSGPRRDRACLETE
jgi:hypothetical protein